VAGDDLFKPGPRLDSAVFLMPVPHSLVLRPCLTAIQMYTLIGTIVECDTRKAGRPQSF
jgi:hypothetical protein